MSTDRRDFLLTAGKLLLVTGAAAASWKHAEAGKERSPPTGWPTTGGR